jgi:nicotinamidase/pyrazinamidase
VSAASPGGGGGRVGWVVDVQHDFMEPPARGGRLYVHDLFDASDPGAELARAAIVRAVAWMRAACDAVVFTGDWHAHTDREIDPVAPDAARGTYPPHCMGLSDDPAERAGAALIPEVDPGAGAHVLGRDATAAAARAAADAAAAGRPVFVHKREFSVFDGNPGADDFVDALARAVAARHRGAAPEFVVCGVAADVCVRHAVDGLLARGHRVAVARDATWGLGLEPLGALLARWAAAGVRVVTVAELEADAAPAAGPGAA